MSRKYIESCRCINKINATPYMGWLRLVGSLEWHISFAEYSLFYRALLQKRPIIWRRTLVVATPYWFRRIIRFVLTVIFDVMFNLLAYLNVCVTQRVRVFDKDLMSTDDFLGECSVDIDHQVCATNSVVPILRNLPLEFHKLHLMIWFASALLR